MGEILLAQSNLNCNIKNAIQEWSGRREVKDMLLKLLETDPDDRPESLVDVINVFETLIGKLNTSNYSFCISVDFHKLEGLKRESVVEEKMTLVQFTNSFLKKEFETCYGYYDVRQNTSQI